MATSDAPSPHRILVTGASGFVGRNTLAPLMDRGYEVHATFATSSPAPAQSVLWHRADLTAPGSAAAVIDEVAPSHLLHLAWFAEPGAFWSSATNVTWVRSSIELLEAFVARGGRRVVMAGSCAEYDWRYGFCSESVTPLAPATLYGTAKDALRTILTRFAADVGLSAAWGRIFFLYGTHEHPARLVPSVIRSLLAGEPAAVTHGRQIRDFLYSSDAGAAFAALLDSSVEGAVNVASGEPISVREVVAAVAEKLDASALVRFGARNAPPDEPPVLLADVTRLSEEVNWRPRMSMDAGLDEAIAWWRSQSARAASLAD